MKEYAWPLALVASTTLVGIGSHYVTNSRPESSAATPTPTPGPMPVEFRVDFLESRQMATEAKQAATTAQIEVIFDRLKKKGLLTDEIPQQKKPTGAAGGNQPTNGPIGAVNGD